MTKTWDKMLLFKKTRPPIHRNGDLKPTKECARNMKIIEINGPNLLKYY